MPVPEHPRPDLAHLPKVRIDLTNPDAQRLAGLENIGYLHATRPNETPPTAIVELPGGMPTATNSTRPQNNRKIVTGMPLNALTIIT